ncbi:hypothetical protein NLG97_g11361 [Lecanicillium saksenae]|uniref:Uncharacterized protein n=1 Tax=Lecanicillium saksenae TaxID=468837 RepID=A0ACC1QDQ5_9HYPO|nr:hypothetical protein NLG97_g11361 [Lecanicillium saksenae]
MSLFGQPKTGSVWGQQQPAQQSTTTQQTSSPFGQTLGGTQGVVSPPQQTQQMPTLSQSQAQLSSSLWQPGKETPRRWPRPRTLSSLRMTGETKLTEKKLQIRNPYSNK